MNGPLERDSARVPLPEENSHKLIKNKLKILSRIYFIFNFN